MKSKFLAKMWFVFLAIAIVVITVLDAIYGKAEIIKVILLILALALFEGITVLAVIILMDRDEL